MKLNEITNAAKPKTEYEPLKIDNESVFNKETAKQTDVVADNTQKEVVAVQEKPATPEKVTEFIETQYQKLEGPKVVSKIDLSQFDKPKSKNDAKYKVKLIHTREILYE